MVQAEIPSGFPICFVNKLVMCVLKFVGLSQKSRNRVLKTGPEPYPGRLQDQFCFRFFLMVQSEGSEVTPTRCNRSPIIMNNEFISSK